MYNYVTAHNFHKHNYQMLNIYRRRKIFIIWISWLAGLLGIFLWICTYIYCHISFIWQISSTLHVSSFSLIKLNPLLSQIRILFPPNTHTNIWNIQEKHRDLRFSNSPEESCPYHPHVYKYHRKPKAITLLSYKQWWLMTTF